MRDPSQLDQEEEDLVVLIEALVRNDPIKRVLQTVSQPDELTDVRGTEEEVGVVELELHRFLGWEELEFICSMAKVCSKMDLLLGL